MPPFFVDLIKFPLPNPELIEATERTYLSMMKTPDQNILEAIFMKHYKEWCLLSFGYLENEAEAEDVVQDVFVKLLLRDGLNEILDLKNYVHVAVRNMSLTRVKALKKERKTRLISVSTPSFESDIIKAEIEEDIRKRIEALPGQSKRVFKLCVLEGQKYVSAASDLGISVNTVKYHLKKSFKILRLNLRNIYFYLFIIAYSVFF